MTDEPEDEGMDVQVLAAATILANLIALGRVARMDGVRLVECPFPAFSYGALAWLSGFTGSSISSLSGTA